MLSKRYSQDDETLSMDGATPAAAETLRSTAAPPPPPHKEEEKMSVFWRVFGGTILSIVALAAITLYNNLQSSINELRAEEGRVREALAGCAKREDLDREREARANFAKKDDVDTRIKTQYDRIRVIEGYKADIEAVKERAAAAVLAVDALKKDVNTSVDALKRDTAAIELFRERLTVLTGEAKLATEAVQRVQTDVEKNRAADLERKLTRDAQAKSVDDAIRDLQRAVQDCREKLIRLEGAGPSVTPASLPAPRPTPVPKSGE